MPGSSPITVLTTTGSGSRPNFGAYLAVGGGGMAIGALIASLMKKSVALGALLGAAAGVATRYALTQTPPSSSTVAQQNGPIIGGLERTTTPPAPQTTTTVETPGAPAQIVFAAPPRAATHRDAQGNLVDDHGSIILPYGRCCPPRQTRQQCEETYAVAARQYSAPRGLVNTLASLMSAGRTTGTGTTTERRIV